ncbi:hypothetical protein [Candidatus Tisiphia endosymbiont of Dascillus cervinus]|uniref:hypothetical protein n=1 Tax=Candidatus Tisiphia endosymbiont of Dascillus cervinus TaxID=3066253 RepID=UPI00312C9B74
MGKIPVDTGRALGENVPNKPVPLEIKPTTSILSEVGDLGLAESGIYDKIKVALGNKQIVAGSLRELTDYYRTLEEEMPKETLEQESIQIRLGGEKPLTLEQEEQLAIKILNNQKHILKLQGIKLDDHDAFYTLGRFYNADNKTPLEQKAAELFFKEKDISKMKSLYLGSM